MAKTAKSQEIAIPAKGATSSPAHVLCMSEAMTPDKNAPASNWPSIAILMTPDRSEIIPAIAPKISGTARIKPPCSSPVKGTNFPAAAQQRNDIRKAAPNIPLARRIVFLALN